MSRLHVSLALVCLLPGSVGQAQEKARISKAKADEHGFLVHTVESSYQDAPTSIRVLLPTRLKERTRYHVLYILPVEARDGSRYGDGLLEVKKHGLHDKHDLICVFPTFAHLPWYADHPSNRSLRQETYLLRVVLPFVEKTYPVQATANGRLLLGFSKSGWGAWTLLLRHPDVFGKAAAWDAPLAMDAPGRFGSGEIFGSKENFAKYQVTKLLKGAPDLGKEPRLILLGYGNFRKDHLAVHALMDRLGIAHTYRDGPRRKHDWHSGWVSEAVRLLVQK
jgi:hypothetical protein